jgi:kynureninase
MGSSSPFDSSEEQARRLDARDPLASFRERFLHPRNADGESILYFAGNSLGLQPVPARDRVEREMKAWEEAAVGGHFKLDAPWYSYHQLLSTSLARLCGASPEEVVAMNSLTVNLHLMMTTFYRPSPGRAAVLMEERSFPSDTYAVSTHIRSRGLDPSREILLARPRLGEDCLRTEDLEALLEREGGRIALVMMEGVHFATGQAFDLQRIAAAARRQGCTVGLDLAHAIGNIPLSLHDWGIDFAVWCSYKYLNGGPGTVGGCFVHSSHGSDLSLPRLAGWWGNDPATRFKMDPDFIPRAGAEGWQVSNPPILAMAPLKAALEIIDEVGIEAMRAKSVALTGYLESHMDRLDPGFCRVITPREPSSRGCQLSLRIPRRAREVLQALEEAGIVCDFREPDLLRVAPVPLTTRFHDVWSFSRILGEIAASPRFRS